MTAVLDRLDVDFLEKEVGEFEHLRGAGLRGGELPEASNCGGNCFGCCTAKVRADGVTGIAKAFARATTR
jgi:hypothetical protein